MDKNANRERYINLLKTAGENRGAIIGYYDFDDNNLINYLDHNGFFEAPASTKYGHSYPGGLCQHSLEVCDIMMKLNSTLKNPYPVESIILVALLHDIYKANYYEDTFINKKVYNINGSKYDENGRYDWVSEKVYKVKDANDRLLISTGGVTSYMLISSFITLNNDETIAIVNSPIGLDNATYHMDLPNIMHRCNLLTLLHSAEIMSNYCYDNLAEGE
jgi:hypothetical protein